MQLEPTAQRLNTCGHRDPHAQFARLRDFEARRAKGLGTFITREEIAERGSSRLSDMLRAKRGVNIVKGGKVRFVAYRAHVRIRTSGSTACCRGAWRSTRCHPSSVEVMELYPYMSTVPIEFQSVGANTYTCGTIVIWTRIPNGKAR